MNNKNIFTQNCVKYSLKNATQEFSLIRLRMTIGGVRFSYCLPVEYKIKSSYWDKEAGKAIEDVKRNNELKGNPMLQVALRNINKEIEKTTNTLIKIIESYKSRDITPTASLIKEELIKALKKKKEEEKPIFPDFISYIDYYMDLCKQGKILNVDGTKLSPATLATYKSTRNILKKYAAARNITIKIEAVNLEFRNDFINFLYDIKHHNGEYKLNSIGKFIKTIKVFMRHAFDNNVTTNNSVFKKDFVPLKEEANTIYLTENELAALYALELPTNQAEVRDCFLISCYTGLRYSDISRLSMEHINLEKNTITIVTYKTRNQVVNPIHRIVKEILERYGNKLPKPQCNQSTNRMLKKLCEQAGITEIISYTETVGGTHKECTARKCDKVTTHTARRSFATNAYKRNVPTLAIMAITGHKTETSFMKYIRISKEENAQLLQTHEFFV